MSRNLVSADEPVVMATAECLPIDFLRLLFARLTARELCAAACTCHLWRHLAVEFWRAKVHGRWKHGSGRWMDLVRNGQWRQLYRERHLLDVASRAALRDLPWPLRRAGALEALCTAGEDAVDLMLAEATVVVGGGGREALWLGRKYWAEKALAMLRRRQAAATLAALARDPRVAAERPETAALAIAQAHYPTSDLCHLPPQLAALRRLLRHRLWQAAAQPGSLEALYVLNHLVFGAPPPPSPLAAAASSPSAAAAACCPSLADQLAPHPGCGLGLRGCGSGPGAYYRPSNSLLPEL
ncbi:hypothetical protein Agub_g11648, partial [Astrephomene gubernaculifera]